jgi:hypothetical protein
MRSVLSTIAPRARYTVGRQIAAGAARYFCQCQNRHLESPCNGCTLAGAPLIDKAAAREIAEGCDPLQDKREVFIGRRRIDHLWPVVSIVLMLILAMRAPDVPPAPEAVRLQQCEVR